ncbi:hypothetical protein B7R21_16640 [Subtercola boreus]|uniref:RNA 2'-phosphotransferase n=1 Tax=Subtercola boreus TaxID=120213 RepID=A0A3E0VE51_9MICO|nr:hypothetical protein B7R21_16640 [Subtercola boreus]
MLFHGTSPAAWSQIATKGLLPMGRQHVHLSADLSTAVSVGKRKAPAPVVLEIDTVRAANAGSRFWLGNDTIWLSNFIDPGSIRPQ